MARFRQVDFFMAGLEAVGILVPPGRPPSRRTVALLRPRSLDWDLLVVRRGTNGQPEPGFQEVSREVAEAVAQRLGRALLSEEPPSVKLEVIAATPDPGYRVRAEVDGLFLVLCRRAPGIAYRPLAFPTTELAQKALEQLDRVLNGDVPTERELYINTRNFAR